MRRKANVAISELDIELIRLLLEKNPTMSNPFLPVLCMSESASYLHLAMKDTQGSDILGKRLTQTADGSKC